MWRMEKLTIVLSLFLSAFLYAHCENELTANDLNDTNRVFSSINGKEKCKIGDDCQNGGSCDEGTGQCTCILGTSGLYCENIDVCDTLDCKGKSATCIFDTKNKLPKCHCENQDYYLKDDECHKCICGENEDCGFVEEEKWCTCKEGYKEKDGKCEECICGENEDCGFVEEKKVCTCKEGYKEKDGKCEECDCGVYGVCHFEGGFKECICAGLTSELDGKCVECNCGANTIHCYFKRDKTKICKCGFRYIYVNEQCTECDCGLYGVCTFELGRKKCICGPNFIERDGLCVAKDTSTTYISTSSSLMTTILTSTIKSCDCGLGGTCHLDSYGDKICNCFSGFAPLDGHCYECDCGANGECSLETGIKRCICDLDFAENHGKCEYCFCGENSKFCRYNLLGEKECICSTGYAENYGYCEECNCGPYGSCSFEYDRKKCNCKSFAVENNGVCVVAEYTTFESSSTTRTTALPSTTQYCNCGKYSKSCRYNRIGYKICDCFPGYEENYGTCEECNCGPYGSCNFEYGRKICYCTDFAIEMNGVCVDKGTSDITSTTYTTESTTVKECNCGLNSHYCFFEKNGVKVCDCHFGYIQTNGSCSAICNEDKCIHGKCEVVGKGFKCSCKEGFTGQRCEEKVRTKINKQDLWMILLFSAVFSVFILLSCMFCFLTRALNKVSKK